MKRDDYEQLLDSSDSLDVCRTLIELVLHNEDRPWLEALCLRMMNHPQIDVRLLAIVCFGHIARIHGVIDKKLIVPQLERLLGDPIFGGAAEDALQDSVHFT